MPELRAALADYLNRVRGHRGRPGRHGDQHRLRAGHQPDVPGARPARRAPDRGGGPVAQRRGAADTPICSDWTLSPVPVGEHGIDVTALEQSKADAVILTPSHQWPTGSVISAESRSADHRLGARHRCVGDRGRLRRRVPLRPQPDRLHARASHPTMSCTWARRARHWHRVSGWAGWCCPGTSLTRSSAAKVIADHGSPALDQLTFADFLARGEFDRHLRRMRPIYRRRRDALLAALAAKTPELEPAGIAAGLHLITWLPESPRRAADRRRGERARSRDRRCVRPTGSCRRSPEGLIFGYSNLDERTTDAGVDILADIIATVRLDLGVSATDHIVAVVVAALAVAAIGP